MFAESIVWTDPLDGFMDELSGSAVQWRQSAMPLLGGEWDALFQPQLPSRLLPALPLPGHTSAVGLLSAKPPRIPTVRNASAPSKRRAQLNSWSQAVQEIGQLMDWSSQDSVDTLFPESGQAASCWNLRRPRRVPTVQKFQQVEYVECSRSNCARLLAIEAATLRAHEAGSTELFGGTQDKGDASLLLDAHGCAPIG